MTIESCIQACATQDFTVAGLEFFDSQNGHVLEEASFQLPQPTALTTSIQDIKTIDMSFPSRLQKVEELAREPIFQEPFNYVILD
ncbi:hypothetical protein P691DRAFT_767624 [Macrolepiota fuliginosa MF-IS2]|uniref:Uncharacterized protein n=1 Tax=Macrolepiota fuliginosa MF-IS2 TaxID=1400762 RepID=A0A9P5WZE1_9AGAR|nr:hypothetical protein P691DRAFT_767624 [Macrolepiota fuliginosa MF-IS2]